MTNQVQEHGPSSLQAEQNTIIHPSENYLTFNKNSETVLKEPVDPLNSKSPLKFLLEKPLTSLPSSKQSKEPNARLADIVSKDVKLDHSQVQNNSKMTEKLHYTSKDSGPGSNGWPDCKRN